MREVWAQLSYLLKAYLVSCSNEMSAVVRPLTSTTAWWPPRAADLPYDRRVPDTSPPPLPPMRVNTVTMVLVGIVVWLLGLVTVMTMRAVGADVGAGVQICLAGIGFGLAALVWAVPVQRRARRRAEPRA